MRLSVENWGVHLHFSMVFNYLYGLGESVVGRMLHFQTQCQEKCNNTTKTIGDNVAIQGQTIFMYSGAAPNVCMCFTLSED